MRAGGVYLLWLLQPQKEVTEIRTDPIALAEVVRLAFPTSSRFLAGDHRRAPPVRWATLVGVPLRNNEFLHPGDMVIVAVRGEPAEWDAGMREFANNDVVAIATNRRVPASALDIASDAGMPVIALPSGSDLRTAHRRTLTLLLKREVRLAERSAEISRQFSRLAAEDTDLGGLAMAMSAMTGHGVIVQDKRLNPIAVQPPDDVSSSVWKKVLRRLTEAGALPEGWADRYSAAHAMGLVERQDLPDGLTRLVTPIVVKNLARGYLSVVGASADIDTLDNLVLEQGATTYAMAMSRAKAVSETTKRLRGDFIDAVLGGAIMPAELKRQANRLGHNIQAPHSALVFAWADGPDRPSQRRLETMISGEIGLGRYSALVRLDENEIVAFIRLDSPDSPQEARDLAEGVFEQATSENYADHLLCGIGRPAISVKDWSTSYKEGIQALGAVRRIDERHPLYFGDMSVYRLLFQISETPELSRFSEEMLGSLIEYDSKHSGALIETLNAYFANLGNLTRTAHALFVHRNTLQHRLERIAQISGLHLNDAEERLAIQLALKAYKLL